MYNTLNQLLNYLIQCSIFLVKPNVFDGKFLIYYLIRLKKQTSGF